MKKNALFLAFLFASITLFAQVPGAFNYQAIVRNTSGDVISNQQVTFRISILEGSSTGSPVYVETHETQTNNFGLVNLKIGMGTPVSGIFDPGGWGLSERYIKIEFDPEGRTSFTELGTTQLLSVPYAFHSKTVEEDQTEDADSDPENELQSLSINGSQLSLSPSGGTVTLPTSSGGGDNWGTQTVISDATLTGDGTETSPLGVFGTLTDNQELSLFGRNLSISRGNSITLPEDDSGPWTKNGSYVSYNGGNVGIGISTPYYTLELKNDGDACKQKLFTANSGTGANNGLTLALYNGSNSAELFNHENGDLAFGTNSSYRMWILANGNIYMTKHLGLGVLSPYYNFELKDDGDVCKQKFFTASSGETVNDGLSIGLYNASKGAEVFNHENGDLAFGTNSIYRMRILANGNIYMMKRLLVGSYGDASAGLHVKGSGYPDSFIFIEANSGQDAGLRLYEGATAKWHIFNNSTAGGLMIYNSASSTAIFAKQANSYVGIRTTNPQYALHVNGDAAKTSGTTAWVISSDKRLKDIHGNYEKGLTEIMALQPVKFNYKKGNARQLPSEKELVGFVAQDVQKVFPEAVNQGTDGFLDFNIHAINVAMVNAVKELNEENIHLKSRVDELEQRLQKMESLVKAFASR